MRDSSRNQKVYRAHSIIKVVSNDSSAQCSVSMPKISATIPIDGCT